MLAKVLIFFISGVAFSCWGKVHKTAFSQVYMQEVAFHEFIYCNKYIVCFFKQILVELQSIQTQWQIFQPLIR